EGDGTSFENITITVLPINDAPDLIMDLPVLVTEEDTPVWINLSGYGEDVDGDTFFWNSSAVQHAALSWDMERVNLTIIPETDWNGIFEIELNLSDGVDWINPILKVNVTPVNDAPTGTVKLRDGTVLLSSVEVVAGKEVEVYRIEISEDMNTFFTIDAADIDGDELTYMPHPEVDGVELGTLSVEEYSWIANTNGTNKTVTGLVPYNFTYNPQADQNGQDVILILVHDGLVNWSVYVKFIILPSNDYPHLELPENMNVTAKAGAVKEVNLTEFITDVDGLEGHTLEVEGSQFASFDGFTLVLEYPEEYNGAGDTLIITLIDGEFTVTGVIKVVVEPAEIWEVTDVKIEAAEDGWTVTAQGDEGQEVFLVVEDEEGNKESFPMTWDGERYTAIIEEDDAKEGMQ
ncbi:MAG: hypothetical protein KAH57_11665, partial [Thermoplasmata archaeon]|nr:hypothetical protein [Thermoplasmata archaeon]